MRSALVLGGASQAANALIDTLSSRGWVVSLSVNDPGEVADRRCAPALAPASEPALLSHAVLRHDAVFHLIDLQVEEPRQVLQRVVADTVNVLDAARAGGAQVGVAAVGADGDPVRELALHAVERLVRMYRNEHALRAVCVRLRSAGEAAHLPDLLLVPSSDAKPLAAPPSVTNPRPLRSPRRVVDDGAILVTGGNGFIGGHVVDLLREEGYRVTVLDCLGRPHRDDVDFVLGDVRDERTMRALAERHQGIVNLAGILGTSETLAHPQSTVAFNLLGALPTFEAARHAGIPVAHVTVGNWWMDNPYAITKHAAERLAFHFNREHGTRIAVVRGLNVYGERQKLAPVRKLVPNLIVPALRGEEIVLYGDGEQRMDMIHVRDAARVLVQALVTEHGAWDQVFEAGQGDAPTVNELCDQVLRLAGATRVRHVPMRAGEPPRAVVRGDPSTLAPLGLTASDFLPLEEGLKRTVAFYRAQEKG